MEKLKSCPFCGGEAILIPCGGYDCDVYYQIQCTECNLVQPSYYQTEDEAVKLWNMRAGDKE